MHNNALAMHVGVARRSPYARYASASRLDLHGHDVVLHAREFFRTLLALQERGELRCDVGLARAAPLRARQRLALGLAALVDAIEAGDLWCVEAELVELVVEHVGVDAD